MFRPPVRGYALVPLVFFVSSLMSAERLYIDGKKLGRTYEGIGALSAGASSKLLIDYPEPQRSQILDLLFKPKYGASLQHLKVEIGGDVNSTCGTEPAYARTRAEFENVTAALLERGYETWLMRQAKQRAPAILFESLQWGAPYWIGGGKFYSQDNADYIATFHEALRRHLGLKISYQGIRNETPYDAEWIKTLRRTLDRRNLSDVKISAADQTGYLRYQIVQDMVKDADLANAIYAVGDHYVEYRSPQTAQQLGKPLWAAEDGPWSGDWVGFTKLAQLYNRSYIEGRMTRMISWSLITSYYDYLPLPGSGLMRANEPWSGHFQIQPGIWAVAHTTQFAEPGWTYIDGGCGYFQRYGSYVTLRSPDGQDFTIVAETMGTPYIAIPLTRQDVEFQLSDDLPDKPVHVWETGPEGYFKKLKTIQPKDRTIRITLRGESLYTLSTTTGQRKGGEELVVPPNSPFPMPYRDDFDDYELHRLPRYFIDQSGVFETAERPDGPGRCLRQSVPKKGIEWHIHGNPEPYTVIGNEDWKDYEVTVKAHLDRPGWVSVLGRVTGVVQRTGIPLGYQVRIDDRGHWELRRDSEVLTSGQTLFSPDDWQTLGLRFEGNRITVLVNGTALGHTTDATYDHGGAGFGCDWQAAWFDDFSARPVSPAARSTSTRSKPS